MARFSSDDLGDGRVSVFIDSGVQWRLVVLVAGIG